MAFSAKFVKKELALVKPLLLGSSLELARRGQNKLGDIMAHARRKEVSFEQLTLEGFECVFCNPRHDSENGVMLYLHGGGYCSGDMEYARGVGAFLAAKCGIRVLAVAYRLAPEHPYPAALDDSFSAYRYLLSVGYTEKDIVLCGESAGGGLAYALLARLKEKGMPMPAGLISMSPWTDLTASGASYAENEKKDPSMSRRRLDFFASEYTDDRKNPLVSPLFAELSDLPPSLIFVGGNEIMRSDAEFLHEKLILEGNQSELVVADGLWHAYLLYDLKERQADYKKIACFLHSVLPRPRQLRWMRLDNAAKIYPASRNRHWSNVFRLSANMRDEVDMDVLRSALAVTVRRFPSIAVKLGVGAFWYYLEEIEQAPDIMEEGAWPLLTMNGRDMRTCAFRVLVYRRRIAVEFFHSVTDGNGGLVFLKSLLAEYIEEKYAVSVPATHGVLDRRSLPDEEEFEDCFLKYSGRVAAPRAERTAYHLRGHKEEDGFMHVLSFHTDVHAVHDMAKSHGVSITAFLTAALMQAILEIQAKEVANPTRRRPVKVLLPVNLRKLFPSKSLRNFVLYITPEIDARMGDYTFAELAKSVHHQMGQELTAKRMAARITTNVNSEKSLFIKIMPLFIKNIVMKMVFKAFGEKKCCLTFSNLGAAALPEEMQPYIEHFDFVLNVPASTPVNCSAISYGNTLVINFVRDIKEPTLEAQFHAVLRRMGLRLKVESNSGRL